ncbi:hypothetical protein QAD02_023385 [Eretmocerus hayati]|uniref:Uncharacterized protein n=1 Tax=Eretmocerus hayati TaxID=131215 RepID=A0ACC2PVN3_9HYME|nr:hypothetical protein QAD02_023385 [Eretmocerus hayati]
MKSLWNIGILLLLSSATHQKSTPSSLSYIGAAVEYSPVYESEDGKKASDINADNYIKFITKAAEYSADIIVFPESSLSISSPDLKKLLGRRKSASYIPDPESEIIPCDADEKKYEYSLRSISCAAKVHKMYVVINHAEKVDCNDTNCESDGILLYNTNVVFDRSGRVIAKYRKYNLFGETGTNKTQEPIPTIFKTDFGVTFGQFICFDIIFEKPSLDLIRNFSITDIVYPTHWFHHLPYAYGNEFQAAWAYSNDVNFIQSGFNNPLTTSGGSGIYIGREGPAHVVSENKRSNILIVTEIPKVLNGKRSLAVNRNNVHVYEFDKSEISTTQESEIGKYFYRTVDITNQKSELIDLKQNVQNHTVCYGEFCCEFQFKLEFNESAIENGTKYYRYRLNIFDGVISFVVKFGSIKTCGIMACTDDTTESCNQVFDFNEKVSLPTTFETLNIYAINKDKHNEFFVPVTLATNMKPLNASEFFYTSIEASKSSMHKMSLMSPKNDLLNFGIFARKFD